MCKLVRLTSEFYRRKTGNSIGQATSKCKECAAEYQKIRRPLRKTNRECIVCKSVDIVNGGVEMSSICYRCSPSLARMTPAREVAIAKLKALPKLKGHRNGLWKGGITPIHMYVRALPIYAEWRQTIRERDNYTCTQCSKRGGNMEVDHFPRPFKNILAAWLESDTGSAEDYQDFWDTNNGRTLCRPCHIKTWSKQKHKEK